MTEIVAVETGGELVNSPANVSEHGGFFATCVAATFEDRMRLYNAVQGTESLADHEGEVIELADVVIAPTQYRAADTDELVNAVGYYLVDVHGKSYITVSGGMANAIRTFLGFAGANSANWPQGLSVVPKKVKLAGAKTTWNMDVIITKPSDKK